MLQEFTNFIYIFMSLPPYCHYLYLRYIADTYLINIWLQIIYVEIFVFSWNIKVQFLLNLFLMIWGFLLYWRHIYVCIYNCLDMITYQILVIMGVYMYKIIWMKSFFLLENWLIEVYIVYAYWFYIWLLYLSRMKCFI